MNQGVFPQMNYSIELFFCVKIKNQDDCSQPIGWIRSASRNVLPFMLISRKLEALFVNHKLFSVFEWLAGEYLVIFNFGPNDGCLKCASKIIMRPFCGHYMKRTQRKFMNIVVLPLSLFCHQIYSRHDLFALCVCRYNVLPSFSTTQECVS